MTAPPSLYPPELAGTDRVCQVHGVPRLASGRCSMCRYGLVGPIVPAPSSTRCSRLRCRHRCAVGDALFCVEHRANVSTFVETS